MGIPSMGGFPQPGGPSVNPAMDVSARSMTSKRDPTIVPTCDWSLDDIEIVKRSAIADQVVECLNKGLRAGQVERLGKYSVRIKPLNRPNELLVRAVSSGFSIQLVLVQEGTKDQVIGFEIDRPQQDWREWCSRVCEQIVQQAR